jgi:hypothetical protein
MERDAFLRDDNVILVMTFMTFSFEDHWMTTGTPNVPMTCDMEMVYYPYRSERSFFLKLLLVIVGTVLLPLKPHERRHNLSKSLSESIREHVRE